MAETQQAFRRSLSEPGGQPEPTMSRHSVSESEYQCSCCYDLMVDPTSLECGHSFCRICLATWYMTSKKKGCPQCKQIWKGLPRVNFIMRNTIEQLFPETLSRCLREQDPNTPARIKEFEQHVAAEMDSSPDRQQQYKTVCSIIIIVISLNLAVYLAWCWHHSGDDMLVHKPLFRWKSVDTAHWLSELGGWAEPLVEQAYAAKIDGIVLLALDDWNLDTVFNFSSTVHRKVFLAALQSIKDYGAKPPNNLWDYKSLYEGQTLFLLYGLKNFPRITFLYLYLFEYDDVFLPFLHTACSKSSARLPRDEMQELHSSTLDEQGEEFIDENFISLNSTLSSPTWHQWTEFIFFWLVLPYILIVQFVWEWLNIHYWTTRFIFANCIALTLLEVSFAVRWFMSFDLRFFSQVQIVRILHVVRRNMWTTIKSYAKALGSIAIFAVFWPLIPKTVCDCIFYATLYFSPFLSVDRLYKEIRQRIL